MEISLQLNDFLSKNNFFVLSSEKKGKTGKQGLQGLI